MKKLIKSSALEDAFTVYPWSSDVSYIDGDSGLGLSYVVEAYGDEFMNLDESTLEDSRDILERYFDDEAYTRDFNINNPDEQIESVYDIDDPENFSVEELARYFDYDAYGRDIRLENNMIWDRTRKCWFSGADTDEYDEDNVVFLSNSAKKEISSARFIVEDEHGEIMASADTYEEAETVGGAKIIDTQNVSQSKVGDLRNKYIMGNMTEDELFDALIDEVDNDKAKKLVEKWKPDVIKQNVSQSVDKAVGEAEDYFGTLANGNTVCCTNIITLADKEEVQKIAEKNDCDVKIGEFSVVFFDKEEAADNYNKMLGQSKKAIKSSKKPIKSALDEWYKNRIDWDELESEVERLKDSGYDLEEAAYYIFEENDIDQLNELGFIGDSFRVKYDILEAVKEIWDNVTYLGSSRKPIKSANDYGWEIDSSEAFTALDSFEAAYGNETALNELSQAMGTDSLEENLDYISQEFDFADEVEDKDVWEKFDIAKEILGDELLENLAKAMGADELAECMAFIFRQYDFQDDEITSSRKQIKSSGAFVDKDEDGSPECIIEIKEDGKWKAVGIDKNSPDGWSTEVKFKVFPSVEEAKSSGMAKRIEDAGYSEPDTLRFSSK